jgi:hypothetical protein
VGIIEIIISLLKIKSLNKMRAQKELEGFWCNFSSVFDGKSQANISSLFFESGWVGYLIIEVGAPNGLPLTIDQHTHVMSS